MVRWQWGFQMQPFGGAKLVHKFTKIEQVVVCLCKRSFAAQPAIRLQLLLPFPITVFAKIVLYRTFRIIGYVIL